MFYKTTELNIGKERIIAAVKSPSNIGYYLFLLFTVIYFMNLPYRIASLAPLHIGMILNALLLLAILFSVASRPSGPENGLLRSSTSLLLLLFVFYMILTIPMSKWPGTVMKKGLLEFLKVGSFYFFTIFFIDTQQKLERFMFVYLLCIWMICFEPFFAYLGTGYLGYVDYSMGGTPFYRLTGLTNKIGGNPNGLAMLSVQAGLIAYFYLHYYKTKAARILLFASFPFLFAVLILTGSRSGFLTAVVAVVLCIFKGKHKIIGFLLAIAAILFIWTQMGDMNKVRYESLIEKNVAGRASAENRIEHIKKAFNLFLNRPVFGYGIGTFAEVNFNYTGEALVSHSLYTGVLVEVGILGFLLFFIYLKSVFKNLALIRQKSIKRGEENAYFFQFSHLISVLLITQLVFALWAGNSTYYVWYLNGGLSVVGLRILSRTVPNDKTGRAGKEVPTYDRDIGSQN